MWNMNLLQKHYKVFQIQIKGYGQGNKKYNLVGTERSCLKAYKCVMIPTCN